MDADMLGSENEPSRSALQRTPGPPHKDSMSTTTNSKTILITGASSGIGRATAARLADEGHTVFAAARRLDRLAQLARETTGTVIPVELDVCDPDSVRRAVEAVADIAPDGLDVLVNNAGYALTGPAETL